jgi:hypothetical protein
VSAASELAATRQQARWLALLAAEQARDRYLTWSKDADGA